MTGSVALCRERTSPCRLQDAARCKQHVGPELQPHGPKSPQSLSSVGASPATGVLCWALGSLQAAAEHLGGLPGPGGAPHTA